MKVVVSDYMLTQKIQLTLTSEEINALSLKAKLLGYSPTKYIRFLVAKEVSSIIESIPTLAMSSSLEKKVAKAKKEYKEGKSRRIKSINDLDHL